MLSKNKIEEIQDAISKKINQARKFRDQSNSENQPELAREWQARSDAYQTTQKLINEILKN